MSTTRTLLNLSSFLRIGGVLLVIYVAFVVFVYFRQRSMLFFPSHTAPVNGLAPWSDGRATIGYCREVPNPRAIWLMTHGNAGQAADRSYVLQRVSDKDSLYVLEYPGYGAREGSPSRESMNQAAVEAYHLLRSRNPNTPVCVLAESIGSGPACVIADEKPAPDKIILVVPFDSLANAAAEHFPFLPVRLLLRDRWDNVQALKHYTGPVEIFGATDDNIIPIRRARALASQVPNAHFNAVPGGHNDWSDDSEVKIEP
jgi:pimeloyl-ACP methyl ester carboxylesterase